MSYEVHILKPEGQIALEDWKRLITENVALKSVDEVSSKNPATGEIITVKISDSAELKVEGKDSVLFLRYSRGQLHVKIQGEEDIKSLQRIAKALDAVIEGDEGERY